MKSVGCMVQVGSSSVPMGPTLFYAEEVVSRRLV